MPGEKPLLVLLTPAGQEREWSLEGDVVHIGRQGDNHVVLRDRQVSRYHARIERKEGSWVLYDSGSKNGTFVNGQRVKGAHVLRDGQEIRVALRYRLLFVGPEETVPLVLEGRRSVGLWLEEAERRVWIDGEELSPPLSAPQFSLLYLLYDKRGAVCTREEIVRTVWSEAESVGITDQAIDALVRRLRDRLAELDAEHEYVVTVRGHGFRFENKGAGIIDRS